MFQPPMLTSRPPSLDIMTGFKKLSENLFDDSKKCLKWSGKRTKNSKLGNSLNRRYQLFLLNMLFSSRSSKFAKQGNGEILKFQTFWSLSSLQFYLAEVLLAQSWHQIKAMDHFGDPLDKVDFIEPLYRQEFLFYYSLVSVQSQDFSHSKYFQWRSEVNVVDVFCWKF